MKVLPTLHIHQGRSVTHVEEWPGEDPFQQLQQLIEAGWGRLCIIDVDAAKGLGQNREVVARLVRAFRQAVPRGCIQVGGGIRGSDHGQFFLDQGASWLVVGSLLFKSPAAVEQMVARFHEHLTAALEVRGGLVQRWGEAGTFTALEAAQLVRSHGFRRLLYIDLPGEDGSPDMETARKLMEGARMPLWMGGSLRTPEHVEQVRALGGIQGIQVDAMSILAHPGLMADSLGTCG